jgi:hypothetical protein
VFFDRNEILRTKYRQKGGQKKAICRIHNIIANINSMSSLSTDLETQVASLPTIEKQKEFLGDKLFPLVLQRIKEPDMTSKITGMLLELDNNEICHLIKSEDDRNARIDEGLAEIEPCEPRKTST